MKTRYMTQWNFKRVTSFL